ncbi:sensor domain-containing diguanylate cyclase [Marinobacterium arenosum]|uniref:sensor domain-containing diguanylate cyclase n=1 Tax=Marinobacterium arenosum TaxID=2862496 RepID=UPI001C95C483|nr:sensor domain-containing diguanylate cyclase [Marinobacterium arenosum]MBY4677325.1 sensor domain-containing diguanylate cyclase [Marinobacterium arenosum]
MLNPENWLLEQPQSMVPLRKWQQTVDLMASLFQAPAGFIVQYTSAGYQVAVASDHPDNPYPADAQVIPADSNIFCRKVVESHRELYVPDAQQDHCWDDNPEVTEDGFRSYLGMPINWPDGSPFGTLCLMDFKATDYQAGFIELMRQLRDLVQADLQLIRQFEQLRELAMTDELTGLMNRRGFSTVAQQRISLARRNDDSLGLIYLDMDGLKVLNDNHGHACGDQALKAAAQAIQLQTRDSDIAARIGGDEFVVLASAGDQPMLESIGRRILEQLAQNTPENPSQQPGLSIGTVQLSDLDQPLEHWLSQADQAMYRHKQRHDQAS